MTLARANRRQQASSNDAGSKKKKRPPSASRHQVIAWSDAGHVDPSIHRMIASTIPSVLSSSYSHSHDASALQTLAIDLSRNEATPASHTANRASATSPSTMNPQLRDLLSSNVMHKLQTVLSTSWLTDDRAIERTEELLQSARYYKSWKESIPNLTRSSTDNRTRDVIDHWTNLLQEGLFIAVAPVPLAPPIDPDVFGASFSSSSPPPPIPSSLSSSSSSTCLRFGSRHLYASVDSDDMIRVRVGGGFVDLIDFTRQTGALEGRKIAALLKREELIGLVLLMQERLLQTTLKKHALHSEMSRRLQTLHDGHSQWHVVPSRWNSFLQRFDHLFLQHRIKLAHQQLHLRWSRESRLDQFASEDDAKRVLRDEEDAEERRVRAEEARRRFEIKVVQQASGKSEEDEDSNTVNRASSPSTGSTSVSSSSVSESSVIASILNSIDSSTLPLELATFLDTMERAYADITEEFIRLQSERQTSEKAMNGLRKREIELIDNNLQLQTRLTHSEQQLSTTQQQLIDSTTTIGARDATIAQLGAQLEQQSAAWSKKLTMILDELRKKDAHQREQQRKQEDDYKQQLDRLLAANRDLESALVAAQRSSRELETRHVTEVERLQTRLATMESELSDATVALEEMTSQLRAQCTLERESDGLHFELADQTSTRHPAHVAAIDQSATRELRRPKGTPHELDEAHDMIAELQRKLRDEEDARTNEERKFKRAIAQLLNQSHATAPLALATSPFHTPTKTFAAAANSNGRPLSTSARIDATNRRTPSSSKLDDLAFEFDPNDIITDVSQLSPSFLHHRRSQSRLQSHASSHRPTSSFATPASAPTHRGEKEEDAVGYVPLALFTRLHSRYNSLRSQYAYLDSQLAARDSELDHRRRVGERLSDTECELSASKMNARKAKIELERLERELQIVRQTAQRDAATHQTSLESFQHASQTKMDEMSAIYQQLLAIKDTELAEVHATVSELQSREHDLRRAIEEEKQQAKEELEQLEKSYADRQHQRQHAEATLATMERQLVAAEKENSSMKQSLTQIVRDFGALKRAHSSLAAMSRSLVQASTINMSAVSSSLHAQLEHHTAQLREYVRKYRYELAMRRKYFEMLQNMSGNIKVMVRVRPSLTNVGGTLGSNDSPSKLKSPPSLDTPSAVTNDPIDDPCALTLTHTPAGMAKSPTQIRFEFDHVFPPTATQEDVFQHVQYLVTSFMDGFSCAIFAYGQTGSGQSELDTVDRQLVGATLTKRFIKRILSLFLLSFLFQVKLIQ